MDKITEALLESNIKQIKSFLTNLEDQSFELFDFTDDNWTVNEDYLGLPTFLFIGKHSDAIYYRIERAYIDKDSGMLMVVGYEDGDGTRYTLHAEEYLDYEMLTDLFDYLQSEFVPDPFTVYGVITTEFDLMGDNNPELYCSKKDAQKSCVAHMLKAGMRPQLEGEDFETYYNLYWACISDNLTEEITSSWERVPSREKAVYFKDNLPLN